MTGLDEVREFLRRAEPTGWGIESGRLVTPGAVERMLAHRHERDMGKAEAARVKRQLFGEFVVGETIVVLLAPPGAEMNLVDRDRRAPCVALRRRRLWARQARDIEHHGGGLRTHLGRKRKRVRFLGELPAVLRDDGVFVAA